MVTTDKEVLKRYVNCDCGNEIEFATNQPPGDNLSLICNCWQVLNVELRQGERQKGMVIMRDETRRIRKGILLIFQDIRRPMTVRQVYYQAVSRGITDKSEQSYRVIQRTIYEMRTHGILPYSFITDSNRLVMKPHTFASADAALQRCITSFRQEVWARMPVRVEIWLEKDALSSFFYDVTYEYDVPLYIARGFSSESFLYTAAEQIIQTGKPTFIYYFSDYDPAGFQMVEHVKDRLPRFGAKDVHVIRAALTEEQIHRWSLPGRPTKETTHTRSFKDTSTELDALHPNTLTELIEDCITNHINSADIEMIKAEEAVHKEGLMELQRNGLWNNK